MCNSDMQCMLDTALHGRRKISPLWALLKETITANACMVPILHGQDGSTWKAKISLNLFKYFIQNDVSSQSLDLKMYSCFPLCISWHWWNFNVNMVVIKIDKRLYLTWAVFRTTSPWQATFVLALDQCSGNTVSLWWLKYPICCWALLKLYDSQSYLFWYNFMWLWLSCTVTGSWRLFLVSSDCSTVQSTKCHILVQKWIASCFSDSMHHKSYFNKGKQKNAL